MELQYTYDEIVGQHNYCVTSEGDVMIGNVVLEERDETAR